VNLVEQVLYHLQDLRKGFWQSKIKTMELRYFSFLYSPVFAVSLSPLSTPLYRLLIALLQWLKRRVTYFTVGYRCWNSSPLHLFNFYFTPGVLKLNCCEGQMRTYK